MTRTPLRHRIFSCLFAAAALSQLHACTSPTSEDTSEGREVAFAPVTFADSVAAAHGFAEWPSVTRLDFTFFVDVNDTNRTARRWSWFPQTDSVVQLTDAGPLGYVRNSDLDSTSVKTDGAFINDSYWLLMPFYLVWSRDGYESAVTYRDTMPLSKAIGNKLTVQYRPEGGYTPGDAYDLYVDGDYRLQEWVFRKGGQAEPTMVMDWSDYATKGGLVVPGNHRGAGPVRIYHPEVAVVKVD